MPFMSDILVTQEPGHPPSTAPIELSDAYYETQKRNRKQKARAEQIEALPLDTLPNELSITTKRKTVPALFRSYHHLIASAAFMKVLENFSVGELPRHPIRIVGRGGMDFGLFYAIHVVETKDSIAYDHSEVRLIAPDPAVYSCSWLSSETKISGKLFARPEALNGVNLWVERRMYSRGVLFSDALWAALSDAGIRCFSSQFYCIDIVDALADNSKEIHQ